MIVVDTRKRKLILINGASNSIELENKRCSFNPNFDCPTEMISNIDSKINKNSENNKSVVQPVTILMALKMADKDGWEALPRRQRRERYTNEMES